MALSGVAVRINMKKHIVRIVGGDYRRTPIPVVDAPGLRPTPDRVRETMFNWLHHLWGGDSSIWQVLDLLAGTGALEFEAASRGVPHVQMVENNPAAVAALRALRTKLRASNVRIHAGDASVVAQRLDATRYDMVLLGPPFGQGWIERRWTRLPQFLAPDALIYIEAETLANIPPGYAVLRQGKAGHVHFGLLQFAPPQENDNNPSFSSPETHLSSEAS